MVSQSDILAKAKTQIGQHEIAGQKDNPVIISYFQCTSYWSQLKNQLYYRDEVAWCAAFVCWVLRGLGLKDTNSAVASSYIHWGVPSDLVPGAIVVFKWDSGHYHVSICDHVIDDINAAFCGGNQSDSCKTSVYPRINIVAVRKSA